MGAFLIAVEFLGQGVDRLSHKPVGRLAAHLPGLGNVVGGQRRVGFGKGRLEGSDIAAVAIDKKESGKAVAHQGREVVLNHRNERAGAQGHGAGEGGVVERHAHINGGANQGISGVTDPLSHHFSANGIGANQPSRPVLFRGADGENDP